MSRGGADVLAKVHGRTRMPSDPRDYKLDVSGVSPPGDSASRPTARPYLSVQFACCGVYQRVYRSADNATYRGRCPKCARPVTFRVGQGGTDSRFFVVE